MKNRYYLLLFFAFWGCFTQAQELHFSQYFNSPLLINPANTGFNPDYDYRLGANYRNQWSNVLSTPYKTMGIWGDAQINPKKLESGWFGVGGTIIKDVAGSASLSSTKGYASMAYHQMLGYSSLLSLGFNVGAVNKKVERNKLVYDNQWNGRFFDANGPVDGGETFVNNQVTYFDLQVGLNYAWFVSQSAYFNAGFSILHLNKPKETFFSNTVDPTIPPRYTLFINGSYKLDDKWILNGNFYVSKSAGANETILGINANRDLSGEGLKVLIMGLYYRNKDAIIPMAGYQLNDLKFTISYDVTTSNLGKFNGRQGAYEASVVKSGIYLSGHRGIKCPTMKF